MEAWAAHCALGNARSGDELGSPLRPAHPRTSRTDIPSMPAVLFPDGSVSAPGIETCEGLQGFPRGWTKQEESTPRKGAMAFGRQRGVGAGFDLACRADHVGKAVDAIRQRGV